jgi:hypothetical protein
MEPRFSRLSATIQALGGVESDAPQILELEWTPKLRQANKTHSSANGEWSYGPESTEVHAGV